MIEKVAFHVFDKEGRSTKVGETTTFDTVGIGNFLQDNIMNHYELRVVAVSDDSTLFQVIDQCLVFPLPPDGNKRNKWDNRLKKFVNLE